MTRTLENFCLTEHETWVLYMHLIKYDKESQEHLRMLFADRRELIHKILFAHFGLKKTVFGIQKKGSYEIEGRDEIKEELRKIRSELSSWRLEYDCFAKLFTELNTLHDSDWTSDYTSSTEIQDKEWEYIVEQYISLGIKIPKEEAKDIIENFSLWLLNDVQDCGLKLM